MAGTEQVRRRRRIHKGNHMGKDSDHAYDSKDFGFESELGFEQISHIT